MTSKWKMVPLILDLEASQVFKTAFTSELPALQGKKSHIDNSLGSVLRLLYSFWYISGTTKALTSLAPLSWFVAPCTSAPFAASFRVWALHGSQKWGGNGWGMLKMKHEKGVRYFMVPKSGVENGVGYFVVPKSGVGRVWEGSK